MKKLLFAVFTLCLLALSPNAIANNGADIVEEPSTFDFVSTCSGTVWVFTGERRLIFTRNSIIAFYYGVATEEGTGETVALNGLRVDIETPNGDMQQQRTRYGSNLNIYGEHRQAIGRAVCR